jgi:glucose-6-phosphate 1-dehydrogenase
VASSNPSPAKVKPSQAPMAPAATLFLFGAHGDLVERLLMPALYNLARDGLVGADLHIVGVDHNASTDKQFRDRLGAAIQDQAKAAAAKAKANKTGKPAGKKGKSFDAALWRKFAARITYLEGDFLDAATYTAVIEKLAHTATGNALFYLATAPRFFGEVAERLGKSGVMTEDPNNYRRLVIEKPFGSDLASAQALNARLLSYMAEQQIYRIDHFLGKETVQNILVSRFANGLFESFWNNHYIDHVQITAAETVGVEERAGFYEHTGALRDMVPNHLFQLLAMIAMEPPAAFGADAVRDEKSKVIAAVRPQSAAEARANSSRGQYAAGVSAGKKVPGYRREPGVARSSDTETYVALKVMIDNWRWSGVPFYLRTGKRLSARDTEIAICFKPAPFSPFRGTEVAELQPNFLIVQIQPDEGMWFDFQAKRPGPTLDIERVQMGFAYEDFFEMQPSTGYETLVYDCLMGDQTLFQRADNIENGWRAVQPFLDGWDSAGKGEDGVELYPAGSAGPASADALLAADGRAWHKLG